MLRLKLTVSFLLVAGANKNVSPTKTQKEPKKFPSKKTMLDRTDD